MSKLSRAEIKHIAELAKIGLSEEETDRMAVELSQIVEFVEQLQKVDTKNVTETSQVTGLIDVWREDEIKPIVADRDELLKNAPAQQDGYIKVRRVLG